MLALASLPVGAASALTSAWIALILVPHAQSGVALLFGMAATLGAGGGLLLVGGMEALRARGDAVTRVAGVHITGIGALVAGLPVARLGTAAALASTSGSAPALEALWPEGVFLGVPILLWLAHAIVRLVWRAELRAIARAGLAGPRPTWIRRPGIRPAIGATAAAVTLVVAGAMSADPAHPIPPRDAPAEAWAHAVAEAPPARYPCGNPRPRPEWWPPWERCAPAVARLAETWEGGLRWVGVSRARDAAARFARVDPWFMEIELEDPEQRPRTLVLELASAGRPGLQELVRLLESGNRDVCRMAELCLWEHPAILQATRWGLDQPAAAAPLPPLDPCRTLGILSRALRASSGGVQDAAVAALALVGRPALPTLREAVQSAPSPRNRGQALWSIHCIGIWDPAADAEAREAVLAGMTSKESGVHTAAINALMRRSGPGCTDADAARFEAALSAIDPRDEVAPLATHALRLLRAR